MSDNRPQVSVFIATSLDGFIARADGDVSWLEEGEPIADEDFGFAEFFGSVDALVMGRGSFEKVLEFDEWHYGDKPVVVMSRTLTAVPEPLRDRVTLSAAAPRELLTELAQAGYRRIYLDGGRLVQSFLREGLVDDMTITTIPVLIGGGRPLFGDLPHDIRLRLLNLRSWPNGFVQARYTVVDSP